MRKPILLALFLAAGLSADQRLPLKADWTRAELAAVSRGGTSSVQQAYAGSCDPFEASLSPQDAQSIRYIITSLSEKGMLQLWGCQGALETAGERIRHVHPLRFLAYVMQDPKLRGNFRSIRAKKMVWSRFAGDMARSLGSEAHSGGLDENTLEAFSREARVSYQQLLPYYRSQDWVGFMNALTG